MKCYFDRDLCVECYLEGITMSCDGKPLGNRYRFSEEMGL